MTIKMESLNNTGGIALPPSVVKAAKSASKLYNKAHSRFFLSLGLKIMSHLSHLLHVHNISLFPCLSVRGEKK